MTRVSVKKNKKEMKLMRDMTPGEWAIVAEDGTLVLKTLSFHLNEVMVIGSNKVGDCWTWTKNENGALIEVVSVPDVEISVTVPIDIKIHGGR